MNIVDWVYVCLNIDLIDDYVKWVFGFLLYE